MNIPGWGGTSLSQEIGPAVNLPVSVDNDANAMAAGEAWLGAGKVWDNFICLTFGTGVGGFLIKDKRPFRGRDGFAGGYGHHVIVYNGKPCTCGFKGCWEQYASVPALMDLAVHASRRSKQNFDSPEHIFKEARTGNKTAHSVINRYASYIAVGMTNLIHCLNPSAIIAGGAIMAQGDLLLDPVRRHVKKQAMPVYLQDPVPIIAAFLGDNAGIIGAAKLAIDKHNT